jgi:hypothetical protein
MKRYIATCKVRDVNSSDIWLGKFRSVWANTIEEAEDRIKTEFVTKEGRLPGIRDFVISEAKE